MNFPSNYYPSFATYSRPFGNRSEFFLNPIKQAFFTGNRYFGNANPYYNIYDPYYDQYSSYFNQNGNQNISQNTYINNTNLQQQPQPQQQSPQPINLTDNSILQDEPSDFNINDDPNYTYYGINNSSSNNTNNNNNNLYYDNSNNTSYQELSLPAQVLPSNDLLQLQQQQQQQHY